jgi:hypothetical protein
MQAIELKQIKPNFCRVSANGCYFWFSYETLVAYQIRGQLFCSENQWSVITGKHLNEIEPDKTKRIKAELFNLVLEESEIK